MKVVVTTTVTSELVIGTKDGKYAVRAHTANVEVDPADGKLGGGAPADLPHLLVLEAAAAACDRATGYLQTLAIVEEEEKGR